MCAGRAAIEVTRLEAECMEEANRTGSLIEIVYPEDTNSQGTLFGGHALSLMDFPRSRRHSEALV